MTQRNVYFDIPAPLPGTESPQRALFVDRWGTLLELPGDDLAAALQAPRFLPGAVDALFRCTQAGYAIYLIGNESSVALGQLSKAEWEAFETRLLLELRSQGVQVERCYACLDDPHQGRGEHLRDSVFFLPNTGAMYHARQHDGVHLGQSWVIGDSTIELAAGWRAGCRTAGVHTGLSFADNTLEIDIELEAATLADVLDEILQVAQAARR